MKRIKINFADFWAGFDPQDNFFINLLREEFEVELSDTPDHLFYSVFGTTNRRYCCTKVFFSGENQGPDFSTCDWSMCFDYMDDHRHYRLPLYLLYGGYHELVNKKVDASLLNRKFCNFVVSNGTCDVRNTFFQELSKYRKVDSGGGFLNNLGYRVGDKVEFQSGYKFSMAFENNSDRARKEGYTTEKILQPMQVNSVPIYWGNPLIGREFNTGSFINYHDFDSEQDVIDYIIFLDQDDDEYLRVLAEPWLINNEIIEDNRMENIKSFLYGIFG